MVRLRLARSRRSAADEKAAEVLFGVIGAEGSPLKRRSMAPVTLGEMSMSAALKKKTDLVSPNLKSTRPPRIRNAGLIDPVPSGYPADIESSIAPDRF